MASIESRNGSCRIVFRYQQKKHFFTIGEVSEEDAFAWKASSEELLRLLDRNLVTIPEGCSIENFLFHRGKPPEKPVAPFPTKKDLTLAGLRETYLKSQTIKLEQTTLVGIASHFKHLGRILGDRKVITSLNRSDLQQYVNKRTAEWIDPDIYRKAR